MYNSDTEDAVQKVLSRYQYHEDDLIDLYIELYLMNSDWERSVQIIQDVYYTLLHNRALGANVTTPKVWEVLKYIESQCMEVGFYELVPYILDAQKYLYKYDYVKNVLSSIQKRNDLLNHI